MKKIKNKIWIPTLVLSLIMIIVACETQADTYKEFFEDGERVYIGTPDTVIVDPGYNKLQYTIVTNSDPKITNGVVQTKDKTVEFPFDVTRQSNESATIIFTEDIAEGDYTFDVILKDDKGNASIPYEISAIVYGPNYQGALISRGIKSMQAFVDNVTINWAPAPDGVVSTVLTYEDADSVEQTLEVPNDSTSITIGSYKLGGAITIASGYKPKENAIDIFYSNTTNSFPDKFRLDFAQISPLRLPFDAGEGCYGSSYERVTDGKTGAFWHSCNDTPPDQYPWIMSFDLGISATVTGFRLDERSSGNKERSPKVFQIWGTNDLTGAETQDIDNPDDYLLVDPAVIAAWEADSASKGWVKLLDVNDNNSTTIEVAIDNITSYRYVRVVAIEAINGQNNGNFDEITFFASAVE